MTKIIILVENQFRDEELFYPYYRMKEEGYNVVVAGPESKTYLGKFGIPIEAESIENQNPDDFDAVIVPGGYAPDKMRMNSKMLEVVRKLSENGKVVAAICHAGWVLASADVIKDKKVTSYKAIKDDMKNAGGIWEDSEVVVDGKLITSRTPEDLPAFCKAIISKLKA